MTEEQIYALLPAIHRIRDVEQGGVLRQFVGVLAQQAQLVEQDIAQLYNNWFIETCEEWAVPYLGDLLDVRGLHAISGAGFSQRARVANTLLYRQRKGTAGMLEQLAVDATGWPAKVVEFYSLLCVAQNMNHRRPRSLQSPDLRDVNRLELLSTPDDTIAHTIDVRHISSTRGRYNIPNIGIFLWRLQTYRIARSRARSAGPDDGRYFFDPLGNSTPLPGQTRRALYSSVEARRNGLAADPLPFDIWIDKSPIDPQHICICDLADWSRPPATKTYNKVPITIAIGVDPQLGRLALPAGVAPARIDVAYSYTFSGDLGAGPYDRRGALQSPAPADFQIDVTTTLDDALLDWKTFVTAHPKATGRITISDSQTYPEAVTIDAPADSALTLVSANGQRPHILGNITISAAGATITLDGLLIEGNVTATAGTLRICHSTIAPPHTLTLTDTPNVELNRAISGLVSMTGTGENFSATDTILAGLAAPDTSATFESSTVFGPVAVRELEASSTIFTAPVTSVRRQTGCVRYSFVAAQSITPRRYRCQPTDSNNVEPAFTSDTFGDPAFGQLAGTCPLEIRGGASDGSEMGAFRYLQQPQREINLRSSLDEYLRFGLEAGIFFVS